MNQQVEVIKTEVLSDNWYVLKKVTYKYTRKNGVTEVHSREAYDRGNGATILLYNKEKQSVILTRQFRMPTFINCNPDGMLIEACAGLLDKDDPEDCILREVQEETGYKISNVQKIFEVYMSPGSVTEILYFFIGKYDENMKIDNGGGIEDEEIEVMEVNIEKALEMVYSGHIKDAKTIILLQHIKLKGII